MTLASLVAHHLERQVSWGPVSEALSVREIFNTGQSYYQKELVQRVGILRCFANQCLLFSWSKRDLRFVVKFLWLRDMRQVPPLLLRPKLHHFCSSCDSDHCCSLTPHHSPRAHSRPASSGCTWGRARASWSASTPSPSPASQAPSRSPGSFNCFDECCGDMLRIYFDPDLTLEALWMEVFVQCVDSWSLKNSMSSGCHNKRKAANRNNWKVI